MSTTNSKYSPIYCILGGFFIGAGIILALVEAIHDSVEWTLRIIGITSIVVGVVLILLYVRCKRKEARYNCSSSTTAFIKVQPMLQTQRNGPQTLEKRQTTPIRNSFVGTNGSIPYKPTTTTQTSSSHSVPPKNQIEHYKPRHFAGHGNRPCPPTPCAPLACQEDITPSLRSSFNSLYLLEQSSDSETSSINSMIYLP